MNRGLSRGLALVIALSTLHARGAAVGDEASTIVAANENDIRPAAFRVSSGVELLPTPLENALPLAETGAADALEAMRARNSSGTEPVQNGFVRPLPVPFTATLNDDDATTGSHSVSATYGVRATSFRIEGADRIRVHLERVEAEPGTVFAVWGQDELPRAFGLELLGPGGDIWAPSVRGERAFLEVHYPLSTTSRGHGFLVREVAQLFSAPAADTTCLIDATCVSAGTFPAIEALRRAIAHIEYIKDGGSYLCSGGLLNDTDAATTIPYFLTANHCISSQTVASTVEGFWDYKTAACNGTFPNLSSLPRSSGATLLATSVQSDFAFLRLLAIPSGRVLLGWTTGALTSSAPLSRVSHPAPSGIPFPQSFSGTLYTPNPGTTCSTDSDGRPWGDLTKFLYSTSAAGGTFGGSSGSPVVDSEGRVVGQLLGACGPNLDGCSTQHFTVDGAFSATYPLIAQYLSPSSGPCSQDSTTACVLNNRFRVTVRFRGGFDNSPVDTNAFRKPVTGFANPNFETAFFYFNSPDNVEIMVKMLDQGNTDAQGHPTIAVLFGSATPLRTELTIVDTQNGATRTYPSEFNSQAGKTDFTAFIK